MCFSSTKPKEGSPAVPENEEKTPIDPEAIEAAREQADDFESFLRPLEIPVKDGVFKVTHPNMLDDDQDELYQQMRYEFNQCDRAEEEVPTSTFVTKDGTTTTIEAHVVKGGFIDPFQKDGKRITPSYNVQMAKILLGTEEEYARFKAAGGTSNAIAIALAKRSEEMRNRRASDPKSGGSTVVPEAVAETD